jgi:hypothetical protein
MQIAVPALRSSTVQYVSAVAITASRTLCSTIKLASELHMLVLAVRLCCCAIHAAASKAPCITTVPTPTTAYEVLVELCILTLYLQRFFVQ